MSNVSEPLAVEYFFEVEITERRLDPAPSPPACRGVGTFCYLGEERSQLLRAKLGVAQVQFLQSDGGLS